MTFLLFFLWYFLFYLLYLFLVFVLVLYCGLCFLLSWFLFFLICFCLIFWFSLILWKLIHCLLISSVLFMYLISSFKWLNPTCLVELLLFFLCSCFLLLLSGFSVSLTRHTIKPGTPEHRTTEQGTPAEHRKTGGAYNRILAEQSEYQGIVEHVKSSGTMQQQNNTTKYYQYRPTTYLTDNINFKRRKLLNLVRRQFPYNKS